MAFQRTKLLFVGFLLIVLMSPDRICASMAPCHSAIYNLIKLVRSRAEAGSSAGSRVSVTGSVFCTEDLFCNFVPKSEAHKMVALDVADLTNTEVRHMVADCNYEKPCKMLVSGEMLTLAFLAIEIDEPND